MRRGSEAYVLCVKETSLQSVFSNTETSRSSRPEGFCKKGVLGNFIKFTGKHLCQSIFLNKVEGLRPSTLLKKRLCSAQVFSCDFCEVSKNTFLLRAPLVECFWKSNNQNFCSELDCNSMETVSLCSSAHHYLLVYTGVQLSLLTKR